MYPLEAGGVGAWGMLSARNGVKKISPGAFPTCSCLRQPLPTPTPTCECVVAEKPRDAVRAACGRDLGLEKALAVD